MPSLYDYYFPNAPAAAASIASPRFKKWNRAFATWFAEKQAHQSSSTLRQATLAFKRLAHFSSKLPWQLTQQDVIDFRSWMEAEGVSAICIRYTLGVLSAFFRWCAAHRVDPACPPGFDPTLAARPVSFRPFDGAALWDDAELAALRQILDKTSTPIGLRDRALFILRLNTGVPFKRLLELSWGQLRQQDDSAWVTWRSAGPEFQLPAEAWQAICAYLRGSGRWAGMQAAKFIFVPLVAPGREVTGSHAADWLELRSLSLKASQTGLKLYGAAAGIPAHKLILSSLRDSVIRRKLEQGASLTAMQLFVDAKKINRYFRYRLDCLRNLPLPPCASPSALSSQAQPPDRAGKFLKGDETLTHGYYSRKRDVHAVQEIIAENISGIDQEIACLRQLMRGVLEKDQPHAAMLEVYARASRRLAEILSLKLSAQPDESETRALEKLDQMLHAASLLGSDLSRQQVLEDAARFANPGNQKLLEEIATLRLLLRNVYQWSQGELDGREYFRLVDLYSVACVRLARLLKMETSPGKSHLALYLENIIDRAIYELGKEFGIYD
jgi:integrase